MNLETILAEVGKLPIGVQSICVKYTHPCEMKVEVFFVSFVFDVQVLHLFRKHETGEWPCRLNHENARQILRSLEVNFTEPFSEYRMSLLQ